MKRSGRKYWDLYLLLIPTVAYFVIFKYLPMIGLQIAFREYVPRLGYWGSPWLGLDYFKRLFSFYSSFQIILNTLVLSALNLLFTFPLPILLALLLNEVRNKFFQKFVQNVTYIPHFLSTVVLVGMLTCFTNRDFGIVNKAIVAMGGKAENWMQVPSLFRPLYVGSGIWQNMGWDSIIYIAALAGVDPQLHESAYIDGANRYQCMWHINLPCILPTVIIMLILNSGHILSVGFEKVYLMQNGLNMAVSDVISTYVYRISLLSSNQFELSTAIGLFNSIVNCAMLILVNKISKKVSDVQLW